MELLATIYLDYPMYPAVSVAAPTLVVDCVF